MCQVARVLAPAAIVHRHLPPANCRRAQLPVSPPNQARAQAVRPFRRTRLIHFRRVDRNRVGIRQRVPFRERRLRRIVRVHSRVPSGTNAARAPSLPVRRHAHDLCARLRPREVVGTTANSSQPSDDDARGDANGADLPQPQALGAAPEHARWHARHPSPAGPHSARRPISLIRRPSRACSR